MPSRITSPIAALALLCAAAPCAVAQSAALTVSGGSTFGQLFGSASVLVTTNGCIGTNDSAPFYGTLRVSFSTYADSTDLGSPSGQVSVGNNEFVTPGSYVISGDYGGYNGSNGTGACSVASTSQTTTVVVPLGTSTTTVTAPSNPTQAGQDISIPVAVALQYAQFQPWPSGTATLYYGSRAVASQTIMPANTGNGQILAGAANIYASTKDIPPGTYQVFVKYSGDTNYASSSSTPFSVKVIASQQSSSTALFVTPNPLLVGEQATLQVNVTPTGSVLPTGNATILADGKSVGEVTLTSNGTGTLTIPANIAAGTYSVQALYGGDTYNLPSTSAPVSVTVAAESSTTTTLTATPSTLTQGETTRLIANVTQQIGNIYPAGSVAISANGKVLTTLPLASGQAQITVSTASYPAGTYSLVANYLGNSTNEPSQSLPQIVILQQATTVSASASPNPVTKGNVTTLSAEVIGANSLPVTSGTVAFSYSGNALGTATISSDVAQLPISTSGLATGSYLIQAAFSGNSGNPPATGTFTLVVQ